MTEGTLQWELHWTRARSTRTTEEPGQWLVAAAPVGAAVTGRRGGGRVTVQPGLGTAVDMAAEEGARLLEAAEADGGCGSG